MRMATGLGPYALALLRLFVGVIVFVHGYPKTGMLQGFGGFLRSLGIPLPQVAAVIVMLVEVVGGLALIVGVATRWSSLALAVEMLIITLVVKLPNVGFVAAPNRPGVGAELDLLLLASRLVLATAGPGALGMERTLLGRRS